MLKHQRPNITELTVFGVVAVALCLTYALFLSFEAKQATSFTVEDGIVEYAGAVGSLLASIVFGTLFLTSSEDDNRFLGMRTRRNYWFLFLAILMFIAFGEEISWGQRLLGIATPDVLRQMNAQQETNIHNLWFFHSRNPDGTRKSELALLINANRLYSIFWLLYCCVLPIAAAASNPVRRMVAFAGIPLPPLWVGALFLVSFGAFKLGILLASPPREVIEALDELKETNYQVLFALMSLVFLMRLPSRENVPMIAPSRPVLGE